MKTILVIDDEAFMLELIRKVLESASYKVMTASTAAKGLEAYRAERPDLVITDLIMPDKDGLETIKELIAFDPGARIVAVSGGGRTGFTNVLHAAAAFGARDTLRKPFTPIQLIEMVNKALADPA
jgi:CheY-like chemotaxis protein